MALCSGLASLINNHFGRRALLRGRLRLHAINATALIEETVTTAAPNRGRGRFHGSFAGRLNTPARRTHGNQELSILQGTALQPEGCGTTIALSYWRFP